MVSCLKCKNHAVTYVRYSGAHLCKPHFFDFFERRVKKELRKQQIEKNEKIAVAVSGGKDSIVALWVLKKILGKRNEITAISVNEGIKDYRDKSIKIVKKNCEELGIEHWVVSFSEKIGYTMDEISKRYKKSACSYCGVFRRHCLNIMGKELEIDKIATGHNLDDYSQSILMNIAKGDVEKLARMAPHLKIQKGLIPRIMPLRIIPEKENYLYAMLKNVEFHDGECPYRFSAQRNIYRQILYELEEKYPGTRHSMVKTYDSIIDLLREKFPPIRLSTCEICGEPTSQRICKSCELKLKFSSSYF